MEGTYWDHIPTKKNHETCLSNRLINFSFLFNFPDCNNDISDENSFRLWSPKKGQNVRWDLRKKISLKTAKIRGGDVKAWCDHVTHLFEKEKIQHVLCCAHALATQESTSSPPHSSENNAEWQTVCCPFHFLYIFTHLHYVHHHVRLRHHSFFSETNVCCCCWSPLDVSI